MSSPSSFSWRLAALTSVAALAGIPVGMALRPSLPLRVSESLSNATKVVPLKGNPGNGSTTQPTASREEGNDDRVEAEFARLLGAGQQPPTPRSGADIIQTISEAFNAKSDLRRFLGIYEAASELGKADIPAALEKAREENNPIAIRALERRWAEVDPEGATKAWVEGNGQPPSDAFFGAWAKSNPAGAIRWYGTLPEGDLKKQAADSLLDRIAKTDPQRALDFANQLPEGADQSLLMTRALGVIGAKDPTLALAAAQNLPEGVGRRAGLDSVVAQIAATNLEAAKKLADELPANTLSNSSSLIASSLFKQSSDQAVEWASALPEGQSKNAAYAGIAREWAGRDVEAAAGWLDSLPKGAERDAAVASFANRTAPRDPEGAVAWASTLPPGEQRTAVLGQTYAIWQRMNAGAASDWLAKAPELSASEREAISKAAAQRFDPQGRGERGRRFREARQAN